MKTSFAQRIAAMNSMYKLPTNDKPSLPANVAERLIKFKATLLDEMHEIDEILKIAKNKNSAIDITITLADVLKNITIYYRSEALKYGLPLKTVLDIIMNNNENKLDADSKPIYDANNKFLKKPNY